MRVLVALLLSLYIQACAPIATHPAALLHTDKTPAIEKLPASVQVYLPSAQSEDEFGIALASSSEVYLDPQTDLQAAALDASKEFFSSVDQLESGKRADFILKVKAHSDLTSANFTAVSATLFAELLDMEGKLIYRSEVSRQHSTRHFSESAYYAVYKDAMKGFLQTLIHDRKSELHSHLATASAQSPNIPALIKNNTLQLTSTGTGFFINQRGHVVTNQHVIEQCVAVTVSVDGKTYLSQQLQADKEKDIAILKTGKKTTRYAYFNTGRHGQRLGENVLALGYPLHGVLSSSINLTTGNISSLLGVKDDDNVYQITTPIQAGNSGGPLLNQRGLVAGVVQSKLNALELSRFTGDLAQNVNFAVKSSKIVSFLQAKGIPHHSRSFSELRDRSTVDLAEEARAYTVQIKCHG